MTIKLPNKYYYLPVATTYLLVSYLCLTKQPIPNGVKIWFLDFPGADKLVHLILFGSLTVSTLFLLFKKKTIEDNKKVVIYAIFTPVLFGAFVEVAQHFFIPGRSGDLLDLLSDSAGVFIGWWMFTLLSSRLSSQSLDR